MPQPAPPPATAQAQPDVCEKAVDRLFAAVKRTPEPEQRRRIIAGCREEPEQKMTACIVQAADDDAVLECAGIPKPGQPNDQLEEITQQLRTYHFVHETFANVSMALTPAQPCCSYPSKKCPSGPISDANGIVTLDLAEEHDFQYQFESKAQSAVIEAVGDPGCTGKLVTYRRELELRDDGNLHITVVKPAAGP